VPGATVVAAGGLALVPGAIVGSAGGVGGAIVGSAGGVGAGCADTHDGRIAAGCHRDFGRAGKVFNPNTPSAGDGRDRGCCSCNSANARGPRGGVQRRGCRHLLRLRLQPSCRPKVLSSPAASVVAAAGGLAQGPGAIVGSAGGIAVMPDAIVVAAGGGATGGSATMVVPHMLSTLSSAKTCSRGGVQRRGCRPGAIVGSAGGIAVMPDAIVVAAGGGTTGGSANACAAYAVHPVVREDLLAAVG
jgi:hypothetical protein